MYCWVYGRGAWRVIPRIENFQKTPGFPPPGVNTDVWILFPDRCAYSNSLVFLKLSSKLTKSSFLLASGNPFNSILEFLSKKLNQNGISDTNEMHYCKALSPSVGLSKASRKEWVNKPLCFLLPVSFFVSMKPSLCPPRVQQNSNTADLLLHSTLRNSFQVLPVWFPRGKRECLRRTESSVEIISPKLLWCYYFSVNRGGTWEPPRLRLS